MVEERSILVSIILSILTLGLYNIIWIININDDIDDILNEESTDGLLIIIYSIITFGIYYLYWLYKCGKRLDRVNNNKSNSCIIYLIFGIVGLSLIALVLIQYNLNTYALLDKRYE